MYCLGHRIVSGVAVYGVVIARERSAVDHRRPVRSPVWTIVSGIGATAVEISLSKSVDDIDRQTRMEAENAAHLPPFYQSVAVERQYIQTVHYEVMPDLITAPTFVRIMVIRIGEDRTGIKRPAPRLHIGALRIGVRQLRLEAIGQATNQSRLQGVV